MNDEMRKRVLAQYTPPFRYENGYIWDSKTEMVADSQVDDDIGPRVRGWGRMKYLPESEALYEATGHAIAEAMTKFWRDSGKGER
jgi:hypothetical protein